MKYGVKLKNDSGKKFDTDPVFGDIYLKTKKNLTITK